MMRRIFSAPPLFLLFALLPLWMTPAAVQAQQGGFVVQGVEVSATAGDATTARVQALSKAEIDAFALLLAQHLPAEQAQARAAATGANQISRMVRGYEVQNERMGATSYSATLDVAFDPAQVRAFLGQGQAASQAGYAAGMPPAAHSPAAPPPSRFAQQRSSVLVLPVLRAGGQTLLWEERNVWRSAWNRAERRDTQLIRLPIGDQSDRMVLASEQALTSGFSSFSPIAERYQASAVVVALAYPTISSGVNALGVTLRQLGQYGGGEQELTFERRSNEGQDELMLRAVDDIMAHLVRESAAGGYAGMAAPATATPPAAEDTTLHTLTVLSRLERLNDWVALRARLMGLQGVEGVEMSAISNQQVDMVVRFRGDLRQLESRMRAQGLRVGKTPNYWIVGM